MTNIIVEVHGGDDFEKKLAELQVYLRDLRPFWPLLVPIFIGWMGAQFATEGGWGGNAWAPLSAAYAVEKARSYPGRTILIREGDLRRAASEPSRVATPRTLTLTIDSDIAGYHQEGTDKMPARPLIPEVLPPIAVREVEEAAHEYVSTLINRLRL